MDSYKFNLKIYIDFQIINFTRPEGGDNTSSISPTDNAVKLFIWNLKIASVLWPNMQGIGHAAIVNYCKWPITQQIRPQDAPEGFACFEFFLTHHSDEMLSDEYHS